jgi:hypothetical protein
MDDHVDLTCLFRGREDDPFGTGLQMFLPILFFPKKSGAFKHNVDVELLPG